MIMRTLQPFFYLQARVNVLLFFAEAGFSPAAANAAIDRVVADAFSLMGNDFKWVGGRACISPC